MKTASLANVKAKLNTYLKRASQEPVIVTRNGKAVGLLLAVTDPDEMERLALAYSPKFQAMLAKSRRQIERTGGIPHEVFWKNVEARAKKSSSGAARARPHRTPSPE